METLKSPMKLLNGDKSTMTFEDDMAFVGASEYAIAA
jgi:hypothetical protein